MKTASLENNLNYNNDKVSITVMLETETSKEIRILFKKGQLMKEHKAGFPITVQVHKGAIVFGVAGKQHTLNSGDLIYLDANVPHDLLAKQDSIVRLTLSKFDKVERVKSVVE
jgi:quercetin dioxygenase-like cupin family protein